MSSVIPASSHPASTSSSILDPASLSIALPAGNAPPHIKRASLALLEAESAQFGAGVLRRVKLADVSVDAARVHRTQTTFAFDVVIGEDMVDVRGQLTVACAAFLVESCASVAAAASASGSSPVLQATNLHYHAPASAYHRLRVICRVLSAAGNRDAPPIAGMPAVSVYAEVWDDTTGHLCVSGSLTAQSPITAAASMALQPARL